MEAPATVSRGYQENGVMKGAVWANWEVGVGVTQEEEEGGAQLVVAVAVERSQGVAAAPLMRSTIVTLTAKTDRWQL